MLTVYCFLCQVLAPAAFGVVVQAWKCVKVIRLVGFNKDTSTAEADEVAYQYLSKLLMPFVIGFAIFSCHCQTHEGWFVPIEEFLRRPVCGFARSQLRAPHCFVLGTQ